MKVMLKVFALLLTVTVLITLMPACEGGGSSTPVPVDTTGDPAPAPDETPDETPAPRGVVATEADLLSLPGFSWDYSKGGDLSYVLNADHTGAETAPWGTRKLTWTYTPSEGGNTAYMRLDFPGDGSYADGTITFETATSGTFEGQEVWGGSSPVRVRGTWSIDRDTGHISFTYEKL